MSEGTYEVEAEIFCAGEQRGKPYTENDFRDMVRNFNDFSIPKNGRNALLNVPGVLGHEEDQEALDRSDLPAAAWTKGLRIENRIGKDGVERPTLIAKMGEMPGKVAQALKAKRYRTVSAEIYDDPPEGIPGCLHGDTPVFDPVDGTTFTVGERWIRGKSFHVWARSENGIIVVAKAERPWRYQPSPMCRLGFDCGSAVTVTYGHRFWVGDSFAETALLVSLLREHASCRLPIFSASGLEAQTRDASHSIQTVEDCLGRYFGDRRLCGELLRSEEEISQGSFPSRDDVLQRSRSCSSLDGSADECASSRRSGCDRRANSDSALQIEHRFAKAVQCREFSERAKRLGTSTSSYERCERFRVHASRRQRLTEAETGSFGIEDLLMRSCSAPSGFGQYNRASRIVKAEDAGTHEYFDFHVPEFENYWACGFFHHNTGKMLRRIAFLGGDIPHVKAIDDLPDPKIESHREIWPVGVLKFSEVRASRTPKAYWVFSEVTPMFNRQMFLDDAAKKGMDTTKIPAQVPDETLAEFHRYLEANKPKEPNGDEVPPEGPERDKFKERVKMMAEKCGMKFADASPPIDDKKLDQPKNPPDDNKAVTHREFRELVRDELAKVVPSLQAAKKDFENFSEQRMAEDKKAGIVTFCENQLKRPDGARLTPAMLDRNNPANVIDELMRLDARTVVTKFSEHGKAVELTALDIRKRQIQQSPPLVKFRELVGTDGKAIDDEEVAKVQQHVNRPEVAKALEAAGKSGVEHVAKFAELRKKDPTLTATRYGVPEAA